MNNKYVVSVIIPIHNSGSTLTRCLDSIFSQDFDDFELILVDNNSTDSSPQIIKKYQKQFPKKIKAIKCSIQSAGAARNAGIKKASGKYIYFIDSDDYIEKDCLSTLYNTAEDTDSDIVIVPFNLVKPDSVIEVYPDHTIKNFKKRGLVFGPAPWAVFIEKNIILKNNLYFDEAIIYEDLPTIDSYFLYARKITEAPKVLYNYIQTKGSLMNPTKWRNNLTDIFRSLELLSSNFENHESEYHDELENIYIGDLLYYSPGQFIRYKEGKKYLKKAADIMRKKYPKWYKNKYFKTRNVKYKIICFLYYYKMSWLVKAITKIRGSKRG